MPTTSRIARRSTSGDGLPPRASATRRAIRPAAATRRVPDPQAGSQTVTASRARATSAAVPEFFFRLAACLPRWTAASSTGSSALSRRQSTNAGDRQSVGKTAGEALDALAAQLDEKESGTLLVVQAFRPDRFFTAAQQQRLGELWERWQAARTAGPPLPGEEQKELEALVEAEVQASAERARALLRGLSP